MSLEELRRWLDRYLLRTDRTKTALEAVICEVSQIIYRRPDAKALAYAIALVTKYQGSHARPPHSAVRNRERPARLAVPT